MTLGETCAAVTNRRGQSSRLHGNQESTWFRMYYGSEFTSLADAREKIAAWLKEYNESRPHRALNDLAPLEYLAQLKNEA